MQIQAGGPGRLWEKTVRRMERKPNRDRHQQETSQNQAGITASWAKSGPKKGASSRLSASSKTVQRIFSLRAELRRNSAASATTTTHNGVAEEPELQNANQHFGEGIRIFFRHIATTALP